MNLYQQKKIDQEFIVFTKRHFVKPSKCGNLEQIQFYISELTCKIDELRASFNYVPDQAHKLLSQYQEALDQILLLDFKNSY